MPRTPTSPPRRALPRISDAEWTVLNVVWSRGPATANQVVDALADHSDWKPKTIHTLLRRLVGKGAITFQKLGREHVFRSRIDPDKARHAACRSLLQRLFNGQLAPFLANFLDQEKLSEKELRELRQILDANQP